MFGTALIVFREVLEAALIIGIVAAATRGIPRRNRWIGAGLAAGPGITVGVSLAMKDSGRPRVWLRTSAPARA